MMESFFARFEQIALNILKKFRQIYLRSIIYCSHKGFYDRTAFIIQAFHAFFFSFFMWGRVDCGVHPYKHSWIFQKRLTVRIWDFLTFNIYYLGPFSQTFRPVSLFLWKLEPFCRGWLKKFCLVAKMHYFLPYLKAQVKS